MQQQWGPENTGHCIHSLAIDGNALTLKSDNKISQVKDPYRAALALA